MTDCLWIGVMIAWIRRLTEGTEDCFDVAEDNPVKEDVGVEVDIIRSLPKDASGVISKGWCVQGALSSGFIN